MDNFNFFPKPFANSVFRPMIDPNDLYIPNFNIRVIRGTKYIFGFDDLDLNMVEIHPIEFDSSLLFYNRWSNDKFLLPISAVYGLETIPYYPDKNINRGEKIVDIKIIDLSNNRHSILIALRESEVEQFLENIKLVQQKMLDDTFWKRLKLSVKWSFTGPGVPTLNISGTSGINEVSFYPGLPFLSEMEKVAWSDLKKKYKLNKSSMLNMITNYRVFQHNCIDHEGMFILLSDITKILLRNQRGNDTSDHDYEFGPKIYFPLEDNSNTIDSMADLIIEDANSSITLQDVFNPHFVVKTIHTLRDNIVGSKAYGSTTFEYPLKNDTKDFTQDHYYQEHTILCSNCKFNNGSNSIFCNQCGAKLSSEIKCSGCNNKNAPDAIYCNMCGKKLNE